ncbi:MAG: putative toxin-antitoxin system toxin component, PIN family [Candidatus Aminicenantes bacterium]|nr:putative toxin-antitoxin system toxin component, PIN family [Candidatus Aminicenantes bacterium]
MTRVVFDTNVFLSAFIFGGKPEEAFQAVRRRRCLLVVSPPILAEVARILKDKFEWDDREIEEAVRTIGRTAELVKPEDKISILEDDADNRILKCAAAGNADFIVSGDRHLISLGEFRGIPIIRAAEFLRRLGNGD